MFYSQNLEPFSNRCIENLEIRVFGSRQLAAQLWVSPQSNKLSPLLLSVSRRWCSLPGCFIIVNVVALVLCYDKALSCFLSNFCPILVKQMFSFKLSDHKTMGYNKFFIYYDLPYFLMAFLM